MNATGHGNGNVKAEIIKRKLMLKADDYDHTFSLWTKQVHGEVQGLIFLMLLILNKSHVARQIHLLNNQAAYWLCGDIFCDQ